MATQVRFESVFSCDGSLWFRFNNGESFSVNSLHDGVMVIKPIGCTINSFAKNIAGCFEEGSNFNGLKAVKFELDGAYVTVSAENAKPDKIVQLWNQKMEEKRIKYEKEEKECMKTPKYYAKRAKSLKSEYRRQNVKKVIKQSIQNEELQFKDEEARKVWNNFVEVNSKDVYSCHIVQYAENWAKFMQYLMAKHAGVTVTKIADQTSNVAEIDKTDRFILYCAVNVLSHVWKHGEELGKWHNKKYGYEGNDVGNPYIMANSIG